MSRRAAFLDRDGTLNVAPPAHQYLTSDRDFVWQPGAVRSLVRLAEAGYVLTVVSNQRGIARGMLTPEVLARIEARIQTDLARHGCAIEAFRYCPHDHEQSCRCRKPKPGMIQDLAAELGLDLARSWMIGDAESDVSAGQAAGCSTALIGVAAACAAVDVVAPSLARVVEMILMTGVAPPAHVNASSPNQAHPPRSDPWRTGKKRSGPSLSCYRSRC